MRWNRWFGWDGAGDSLWAQSVRPILDAREMGGSAKDPGRVLINFETTDVKEEFERIKALGATVIKAPYEMEGGWIATLADPDGNYFQLVTPMG